MDSPAGNFLESGVDAVELGRRLRAYRIGAGLKAEDLAKSLDLSRAAVYLLEKGEIVKVDTLVRLARVLKVSVASLLGVEMEYYATASGYFERMRQLEAESVHLLAHIEPVSFLLTTDEYLVPLREMLLDAAPPHDTQRAPWLQQVEEIMAVFALRKQAYATRRPAVTSLVGLRQIERFMRFGLGRGASLPAAVRRKRGSAVQREIDHIIALLESPPVGVQIGVVEGSLPGVNFQVFRQAARSYVGVSPLRLHEIPDVHTAVATVTNSVEGVTLYDAMFNQWWARARQGEEGARLLKDLMASVHKRRGA